MIDVFVSRPTWVSAEFEPGLTGFLGFLKNLEINGRTLGATDYPSKSPLDEVISLMDQCAGAVILGYPQIVVTQGAIKDKVIQEDFYLPTEWNHIEAGLAYARGLPLLVIHHLGVKRGIFDRGAIGGFLYERDLTKPAWPLAADLQGAIGKWKKDCLSPSTKGGSCKNQLDTPTCPNCSMVGRPFFLSPIPLDFQSLDNATHECTKCHWKTRV